MIQQQMNEWILHPESLNADSLQVLRDVLKHYPYYQTAWILYLKNLFLLHDETFQTELRRGALYVADLSVLFYYIEGDKFVIQKHAADQTVAGNGSDRTLDLIERFLSETPEQPQPSEDIPLAVEANVDYTSVLMDETGNGSEGENVPLLRGQELIDSFLALDQNGKSPVVPVGESPAETVQDAGPEALPSAGAITEADRISLESEEEQTGEAEKEQPVPEEEEDESYFTETLAKIYIKQQRYDKALEIIKKLNLKYPKKNIYFADQIRFLEKLIINAKSK
ncbi:tetratricopeptide repeat protein [uncultured Phocaeicola sp.]|uniref:tetratricopeptide repeat protein n=1 Tax=uncultured Phocaeicola sp. TaxID=990718 RepID=UPI0015B2D90B|nr:tetratricopeptide repeat protein [uncultured Phocaeicola sp.]